jgi:hypothetical protein
MDKFISFGASKQKNVFFLKLRFNGCASGIYAYECNLCNMINPIRSVLC